MESEGLKSTMESEGLKNTMELDDLEDPINGAPVEESVQVPTQVFEQAVEAPISEPMDQDSPSTADAIETPSLATQVPISYTPQFQASAASILARIREHEAAARHGEDNDSNGEASRSGHPLDETLAMPTPLGQLALTAAARIDAANVSARLALKRKRDEDHDAPEPPRREAPVDFSQSTISFPARAPSPPPPWTPPPPDLDEADEELERLRARNLAALPPGVVPAKPGLVGFPPGRASDLALSTYFYSKKRTDLLNVLSLCDQLKPQLLVDILVSVAKKHPDLPLVDSPSWNPDPPPPPPLPSHKLPGPLFRHAPPRPRHGHVLPAPDAKPRLKHAKAAARRPAKPPAPPEPLAAEAQAAEPADDAADDQDALPPTWPKAGEGLYARLAAEDRDRAFLLDENDEEAFSHFAVDKYGKQTALLVLAAA